MKFPIYRYNPETDAAPRMQEHVLAEIRPDMMLRDSQIEIKARDESLSSGIPAARACGSDLAWITPLAGLIVQIPVAWVK